MELLRTSEVDEFNYEHILKKKQRDRGELEMVRPQNCRVIRNVPNTNYFKPQGILLKKLEEETLTLDELESLRLADLEGLYHEDAARSMNLSRATFGRIVQSARRKVARALIQGRAIRIDGGNCDMPDQRVFQCSDCNHEWTILLGTGHALIGRPDECPVCKSKNVFRKEEGSVNDSGYGIKGRRHRHGGVGGGCGRGQGRGQGRERRRGQSSGNVSE